MDLPNDKRPVYVVAAAVRIAGVVYVGVRHFDNFMRDQMTAAGITQLTIKDPPEEGFITTQNKFVDRQTALRLAESSGQLGLFRTERVGSNGLHSENIY